MNYMQIILASLCIIGIRSVAYGGPESFSATNQTAKVVMSVHCDGASPEQSRLTLILRNNTKSPIITKTLYPLSFLDMRFYRCRDDKTEKDRLIWQSPPADWRPVWTKAEQVVLAPGIIWKRDYLLSSVMVFEKPALEPGLYRLECTSRFSNLNSNDQATAVHEFEMRPEPTQPKPSGVVHRTEKR